MKKYLGMSLMLVVSLLALTSSAYATGPCLTCKTPEPGMLALLGAGMAAIGLFSFKGKNRK